MEHQLYIYSKQGELQNIKNIHRNENESITEILQEYSPMNVFQLKGNLLYNYLSSAFTENIQEHDNPEKLIIQMKY